MPVMTADKWRLNKSPQEIRTEHTIPTHTGYGTTLSGQEDYHNDLLLILTPRDSGGGAKQPLHPDGDAAAGQVAAASDAGATLKAKVEGSAKITVGKLVRDADNVEKGKAVKQGG
ncbi:hypothetical protein K437DRAFT_268015 [Tilletiaria anomala UBC 951]|uniref:Uncharacterized protein n=1 Tax=Tilletiaria anomala (strain ATCC 24038 / CBS 436.72 / UBC 951) TaxID=1037660 RepID=A0A066VYI2_TILAU|nr:uncharacterized protein K437DRAFT_268015 [Tilletiaria anomala UBC 951]KDN46792.1 hypothetical protein K437DRAFT_268015 [Tilletiaria anomala UBC 951]